MIYTANTTFYAALPQWSEIDQIFPTLQKNVAILLQESSTGWWFISSKTSKSVKYGTEVFFTVFAVYWSALVKKTWERF